MYIFLMKYITIQNHYIYNHFIYIYIYKLDDRLTIWMAQLYSDLLINRYLTILNMCITINLRTLKY